jgi:hypothetical protein
VLTNLNGFKHPALWPGPQVSGAASTVHRHAPVRCAGATARQRSSFSGRCRLVNCRTGPPPSPCPPLLCGRPIPRPPFFSSSIKPTLLPLFFLLGLDGEAAGAALLKFIPNRSKCSFSSNLRRLDPTRSLALPIIGLEPGAP